MDIIPTILTNSQSELESRLNLLEGVSRWVQIDVVDGKFVNNRTFPLEWLNNYPDKGFLWDIHLMVEKPVSWIGKCSFVMATRVVGHIEKMADQVDFINQLEQAGIESGLAVDLETPIDNLNNEALVNCGIVLLLSVKAGFSGQEFNEQVVDKIKKLKELRSELVANFKIGIDGGVNEENIKELESLGVDIVYSSKYLLEK